MNGKAGKNEEKRLKVCVCDDDPIMLGQVSDICRQALEGQDALIYSASNFDGLLSGAEDCDIAVLDIQMPEEDGIAVSCRIRQVSPACQIIFVSGFVRYVSEVYDVPHLCLVMKDQLQEQLPRFLLKAVERLRAEEKSLIEIKRRGRTMRILPSELCYMERRGHTTYLVLRSGEELPTAEKLDALISRMDGRLICRCHVSFAVHLGSVLAWEKNGFKLTGGTEIPISRAYERSARESFMRFVGDL